MAVYPDIRTAGDFDLWRGVHWLALAALLLRVASALLSERIIWPDEVFQYLEQAHRLVWGYGYIPWEYRYGTRNWLLPGALAGLLGMLRAVGADSPSAYVPAVKVVCALLSISLVYACYAIGRAMYGEKVGRIAAVVAAFWYELVYTSTLATPEVLGAYLAIGAFALVCRPSAGRVLVAGVMLGLTVALRLQYLPLVLVIAAWLGMRCDWRVVVSGALAGVVPVLAAGLIDRWTWGVPFGSFYLNVLYNVTYRISDLFGTKPFLYLPGVLTLSSGGLFAVAGLVAVFDWRRSALLLLMLVALLLPHSLIAHKEYRFVCAAVPLLIVLLANAASFTWVARVRWLAAGRPAVAPLSLRATVWVLGGVAIVSALGLGYRLPKQAAGYPNGAFMRNGQLLAYLAAARQPNLCALANLAGGWWETGGYYYLHRDVPVYFAEHLVALNADDLQRHISHLVVRATHPSVPGFEAIARFGDIELRSGPAGCRPLAVTGDLRRPMQNGIDGRFVPVVTPRF